MKTALILSSLLAGAQSFGIVPVTQGRIATQLFAGIAEENMTSDQKEIKDIQNKWNEIRMLDRETAQKELSGEWLEAYNRYFQKYDEDMERMSDYTKRLEKMIEPPKVAKKTKGQRKRDAYARVLARAGNSGN